MEYRDDGAARGRERGEGELEEVRGDDARGGEDRVDVDGDGRHGQEVRARDGGQPAPCGTIYSLIRITEFKVSPLLLDPCHFKNYDRCMSPLSMVPGDAPVLVGCSGRRRTCKESWRIVRLEKHLMISTD